MRRGPFQPFQPYHGPDCPVCRGPLPQIPTWIAVALILLALILLALAFSGCATEDRCNDVCNSRAIREYDKWVKAAAERDDAKIKAPSPSEQAEILREARTVERMP